MRDGCEHHEIFVALVIFRKQCQMEVIVVNPVLFFGKRAGRNICFNADDRFDSEIFCIIVKFNCTVHYAVVGKGERIKTKFDGAIKQPFDFRQTVEKGKMAMDVKMGEFHFFQIFCAGFSTQVRVSTLTIFCDIMQTWLQTLKKKKLNLKLPKKSWRQKSLSKAIQSQKGICLAFLW